jgi:signal transduction histidine kinase
MAKTKLIICGPPGTREVPLEPKGVVLGRDSACDVILDHYNVSRVHARISQDPFGRWIVEDMDSRNGVLVSGQRIRAQAVQYGQTVKIHPFDLSVMGETNRETNVGRAAREAIPIAENGADEKISLYRGDQTVMFSPVLVHHLNELNARLLQLSGPSDLYSEASCCLAEMLDTLVAIVRLPSDPQPFPESPDILALHFGKLENTPDIQGKCHVHFSKRVLDVVRRADSPVMAGSVYSSQENLRLTVVNEHRPHLVFAAQVNTLGDSIDVLYIDIPESQCPDHMFDFVEAVARQINTSQKSLFLTELEKQEKALREANTQLKQKDRVKDEYVSRVTHDIKGHLAAIQNCLYAAVEISGDSLGERPADFLGRAMNRTRQLTTFVRELLNLTRMRLNGRFEMEAFSLPQTLRDSLTAVEDKAQEKSIMITSEIDATEGKIVGNEFSVKEMITNLLSNAVKYTPENGAIHLRAGGCGDHVRIDIIDSGIGIPAEELDRIFDEFYRASNVTKARQEGTGLGLAIVQQIVERHGGAVSVKSAEGRGSTFTVLLPKGKR